MRDWEQYKITSDNQTDLNDVQHIAHIPIAHRIIEDRKIKSGLVYDESLLNQHRINVAWLSANTWANGSMYGTVCFKFPWKTIVDCRKVYWVEAITKYNPTAFRFLFSAKILNIPQLQSYDPVNDNGPLRLRNGQWVINKNLTSEFMIDEDISLEKCNAIDFVLHHKEYCSSDGRACPDIIASPTIQRTAGLMLARIIAKDHHEIDRLWNPPNANPNFTPLSSGFEGINHLLKGYSPQFGGVLTDLDFCKKVVNGALALCSLNQIDAARDLISHISTKEDFDHALLRIVRNHFNEQGWQPDDFLLNKIGVKYKA